MGHRPFRVPVKLRAGETGIFVACSPWEALEFLERDWPGERDNIYLRACAACRDAVDGFRAPEGARRAVENPARAAGLLAEMAENGGGKLDHGSGGIVLLRAA